MPPLRTDLSDGALIERTRRGDRAAYGELWQRHAHSARTVARSYSSLDPDDPNPPCEYISGPFVGPSPYYNRAVKPIERSDRAKARELMTAAGAVQTAGIWVYKGEPINLKLGMNAPLDAEARDLLNQVGNQLQAGGFNR